MSPTVPEQPKRAGSDAGKRSPVGLGLLAILGPGLSLAGFAGLSRWEDHRAQADADRIAAHAAKAFSEARDADLSILNTIEAHLAGTERSPCRTLETFIRKTRGTRRSPDGIAWAPRVAQEGVADFESSAQGDGAPDFLIRDVAPDGARVPAAARSVHFPLCFSVPPSAAGVAPGFDLASVPGVEATLGEACDGGSARTSPAVSLASGGTREVCLLAQPVYTGGRVPAGLEERRRELRGFAIAVLDPEQMLARAAEAMTETSGLDLWLFDTTGGPSEIPLAVHPSATRGEAGVAAFLASIQGGAAPPEPGALVRRAPIGVPGRRFELRFDAAPEAWSIGRHGLSLSALLFGLVVSALLTVTFRGVLRRETSVKHQVTERTAALSLAVEDLRAEVEDRARAEAALAEQSERLDVTLRSIGDGVITADVGGRVILMNAAAEALTGWTQAEAVKRPLSEVFRTRDAAPKIAPTDPVAKALGAAGVAALGELGELGVLLARDGTERTLAGRGAPIRASDGRVRGVVLVFRDVTERVRAEGERRKLEAQFQHTQRLESLGVLAGGIAHDFNNLLMGVLGNADLAVQALPEGSPARARVEDVRTAGLRASELTHQMLAYSGKGRFVVEPLDLNALILDMAHLLKVSISKRIVLNTELADGLPLVSADASQVRQIVMNLITNASEAIGEGSGVVSLSTGLLHADRAFLSLASAGPGIPEGDYVCLEVTDTGSGMDEATKARIFEPFFTTKFTGRGLGLAAVLGIVRGHGGAIRVDSAPGRGTTFRVLFPALPAAESLPQANGHSNGHGAWRGRGTILVVDDDETVRTVVRRMLDTVGLSVVLAEDGRAGVEAFRANASSVSAVLLDRTMPLMSGEDALGEIRKIRPDVPVFLMSGYTEQDATERFAGLRLSGFVQKPFTRDALVERLRGVLEERRG